MDLGTGQGSERGNYVEVRADQRKSSHSIIKRTAWSSGA